MDISKDLTKIYPGIMSMMNSTNSLLSSLKKLMFKYSGVGTYQLLETPRPKAAGDPVTSEDIVEIARLINHTNKIVF